MVSRYFGCKVKPPENSIALEKEPGPHRGGKPCGGASFESAAAPCFTPGV